MELPHVPKCHSAHYPHTPVVEHLKPPLEFQRQTPRLTAIEQQSQNQALIGFGFVSQLDIL